MKHRSFIMLFVLVIALMFGSVFAVQEGSIRVQMYNANLAAQINTIYPWYRITNTGSTPVNLSDVKIRYFYTIDGEKPQIFKCDWSSAGSANVTGTFVKMEVPFSGADYYFELGFRPDAGYLQPGKSIEVQSRFYKNDWSSYNQTDDYSFNPTAQEYVDWEKIAVQIGEGTVEDFVTSSDFTKDNQWLQEAVTIHLSVTGNGSENETTYYSINDGEVMNGKVITINDDGIYKVSFWSKGKTSYTEAPHQITVKIDRNAPIVTGTSEPTPNANGWLKSDATVTFSATDALSGVASVSPTVSVTTEGAGQMVQGEAKDNLGNTSTTSVTVNIDKTPPVISELYPKNGSVINQTLPVIAANISDNLSGIDVATVKMTVDGREVTASFENGQVQYTLSTASSAGKHTVRVSGCDKAGNASVEVSSTFTVDTTLPNIPSDPAEVAPKLDTTVCTSMADAMKFLYTGENPIQTGATPESIEAKRIAVLRGKVMDQNGKPLPGVKITILNHPEYGQTLSRSDGMFDMAVNGGNYLTVTYEITGYLGIQRQIEVPLQDYIWLPEVLLIQRDNQVNTITLNSNDVQVAKGSVTTDTNGSRQATLIIPSGTNVTGYNGNNLNIRLTEYTVGENGPKKMPATLPDNSAYTYCIDLSTDEMSHIKFNKPIYFYVENFLNFPVGGNVPTGYYDESKGSWVPSDNGIIIRVLSVNNGMADIDVNGNGQVADEATLISLGFSESERQQLAKLYQPGQCLWRVPIQHFSIYDCNWGWGLPNGATGSTAGAATGTPYCSDGHHCYIERENQIVRESVNITGTSFSLNYSSDRVPGRIANMMAQIPLSGKTVPSSLKRIDIEVSIQGQIYQKSFSNAPNQTTYYTWNGQDGYGRIVVGEKLATIKVGYVYQGSYQYVSNFGDYGDGTLISAERQAFEITIWNTYKVKLGQAPMEASDINGWSLNVHHYYDTFGKKLYLGNGDKREIKDSFGVITRVAGNGQDGFRGDGGLATNANLGTPRAVCGVDGCIYIADMDNSRIRKIDKNGIISTIAGTGERSSSGDGGLASHASVNRPCQIVVGKDGCIYFSEDYYRIRRISPDGIISTYVGSGEYGYSGDGGPATQAKMGDPIGLAIGPDGSLYFSDSWNNVIRRVTPDGIINTVAGTGPNNWQYNGDGLLATKANLCDPEFVAVGPDGSLYISDDCRVRKVGLDGIIHTIAGMDKAGYSGDGGLAVFATLDWPGGLCVGDNGSIYITDYRNSCIRRISSNGIIDTIAGNGQSYKDGETVRPIEDEILATQARIAYPINVDMGQDGSLYFSDNTTNCVYRISPSPMELLENKEIAIASEDGKQIYAFDEKGRHVKTIDTISKAVIYKFEYDQAGNLVSITDMNDNVTTISRSGNQIIITAPFGQKTLLVSDNNGYLQNITNPAGDTRDFTYYEGGLLKTITDPKRQEYQFKYDELGRAIQQIDPDGGSIVLERSDIELGYQVKVTEGKDSIHNYVKIFSVETLPTKELRMVTMEGNKKTEETITSNDGGYKKINLPDGTIVSINYIPDPRFGMQAPMVASQTVTTPSGLKYSLTVNQTVDLKDKNDLFSFTRITNTATINGKTSVSFYDFATHTVTSTSPMGRKTVTTLDEKGRVIKVEVPGLVPMTFEYDTHGRLYRTTQGSDADARIGSISYNADGWVESVTDSLLHITSFEYDAVGRVTKQTLPDSRVIQFNYDSNGNMTTLTPPGKPEHGFSYNAVDMTDKYTPPTVTNGGETSYEYNLAKQPTLVTRPDGKTIGFEYDTMGRLVTLTLPDGEIAYTYDATTGNLKNVIGRNGGALTYGYDGSLPTDVTWSGTIKGKVGVTYNNDFAVVTQSVNDGQTVSYAYDNDGLLTNAGDLTASYDPQNGAITGTKIGNVMDSYGYTAFGEVKDYTASVSGIGVYSSSFTYDKLGRISTKTETVNGETHTYQYGYDSIGQLTDVWVDGSLKSHYDYDSNGNRVGGTYDDQDRMIKYGDNTYQYSANGELQQKVTKTGTTKYAYDVLGNLTAVTLEDGTKIEYVIDGANRRVGKKVNGVLVQGWLYQDGLKPVAEIDGNGNVVSRFVYGTSDAVPAYIIKNGTTYRIICDHLGSVRMVIDVNTNQVVQEISYDEWGNTTRDTNPGFQPFAFSGGSYDNETKLIRFGARDYDPETGRWTAKDPIRFNGGDTDLYVYVGNEPINNTDPMGLVTLPDRSVWKPFEDAVGIVINATKNKGLSFGRIIDFIKNGQYWEAKSGQIIRSTQQLKDFIKNYGGDFNLVVSEGCKKIAPSIIDKIQKVGGAIWVLKNGKLIPWRGGGGGNGCFIPPIPADLPQRIMDAIIPGSENYRS